MVASQLAKTTYLTGITSKISAAVSLRLMFEVKDRQQMLPLALSDLHTTPSGSFLLLRISSQLAFLVLQYQCTPLTEVLPQACSVRLSRRILKAKEQIGGATGKHTVWFSD